MNFACAGSETGRVLHATMNRTYDFIEGIIGLVVVVGVIGWGLFCMLRRSYDPAKMLFKCAITIPFVIFCIWTAGHIGIVGPFLIVFMAIVMSIMWTPHIGE